MTHEVPAIEETDPHEEELVHGLVHVFQKVAATALHAVRDAVSTPTWTEGR